MLHYVLQLISVCLLFGAEQVAYSEFLEFFHWKQLQQAAVFSENTQHYESGEREPEQKSWRAERCYSVDLRGTDLFHNTHWAIVILKKTDYSCFKETVWTIPYLSVLGQLSSFSYSFEYTCSNTANH